MESILARLRAFFAGFDALVQGEMRMGRIDFVPPLTCARNIGVTGVTV